MRVELVDTLEGFLALETEWNQLLSSSDADCIFNSWEWVSTWVAIHFDSIKLRVVAVRDERSLLRAIAPFYLTKRFSLLRLRKLDVIRPLADQACGSEYPRILMHSTNQSKLTQALSQGLSLIGTNWDIAWFANLESSQAATEYSHVFSEHHTTRVVSRPCIFSAIDLPSDWDTYLARFGAKTRQEIRRSLRKLDAESVRVVRCESPEEIEQGLTALFDLHNRRWKSRNISGVFQRKPKEAEFYKRFALVAADRGWLRLFVVYRDNVPVAAEIGYVYQDKHLALQSGFDPEVGIDIGKALKAHIVRHCIEQGLKEHDFLGGYSDNKFRWQAKIRLGRHLLLARKRTFRGLVVATGLWPGSRWLHEARLGSSQ